MDVTEFREPPGNHGNRNGVVVTPREYLDQVMRPNLADLDAEPGNIRFALNAVHSVDALAARIYVAAGGRDALGDKDDTAYRERLASTHDDFRLMRDLAKAIKHVELGRGSPLVQTASQVRSMSIGLGQAVWGELEFDAPPKAVVALESGVHRVIAAVVRNAVSFLETTMQHHGL